MENLVRKTVLWAAAWACLVSVSFALFAESPADEPPRYCTVFNHLVKSGGSSVKKQLIGRSKKEGARRPGGTRGRLGYTDKRSGEMNGNARARLETLHNATIIVGNAESLREPLKAVGRECEYFTMMRNPIERLVSAFYYCPTDHDIQNRPSKWCGDSEGDLAPLQDRLLEFAKIMWGNRAFSVMMPSVPCNPKFGNCARGQSHGVKRKPKNIDTEQGLSLHNGIKRILSTYTAVGIMEEWELSMRLFNAKVKSPVRDWNAEMVVNAGTRSSAREELLDWAHTNVELHDLLAADLLLYDFGLALFRQQTKDALLL